MNIYSFSMGPSGSKDRLLVAANDFSHASGKCAALIQKFYEMDLANYKKAKDEHEAKLKVWDDRKEKKQLEDGEKRPKFEWSEPQRPDGLYRNFQVQFEGTLTEV